MAKKDVKKEYEALRKKYSLPDFEALRSFFDISEETEELLLKYISAKITGRIGKITEFLENLLHSETSLAGLYECKFFDENEKKSVFELYKKLMRILRLEFEASVQYDEKKQAEFVKNAFDSYASVCREIERIIAKAKESWGKEDKDEQIQEYLG